MKQYNLKASGKSFEAIDVPSECYIEFGDLLASKPLNSFEGILIVKNVFSHPRSKVEIFIPGQTKICNLSCFWFKW